MPLRKQFKQQLSASFKEQQAFAQTPEQKQQKAAVETASTPSPTPAPSTNNYKSKKSLYVKVKQFFTFYKKDKKQNKDSQSTASSTTSSNCIVPAAQANNSDSNNKMATLSGAIDSCINSGSSCITLSSSCKLSPKKIHDAAYDIPYERQYFCPNCFTLAKDLKTSKSSQCCSDPACEVVSAMLRIRLLTLRNSFINNENASVQIWNNDGILIATTCMNSDVSIPYNFQYQNVFVRIEDGNSICFISFPLVRVRPQHHLRLVFSLQRNQSGSYVGIEGKVCPVHSLGRFAIVDCDLKVMNPAEEPTWELHSVEYWKNFNFLVSTESFIFQFVAVNEVGSVSNLFTLPMIISVNARMVKFFFDKILSNCMKDMTLSLMTRKGNDFELRRLRDSTYLANLACKKTFFVFHSCYISTETVRKCVCEKFNFPYVAPDYSSSPTIVPAVEKTSIQKDESSLEINDAKQFNSSQKNSPVDESEAELVEIQQPKLLFQQFADLEMKLLDATFENADLNISENEIYEEQTDVLSRCPSVWDLPTFPSTCCEETCNLAKSNDTVLMKKKPTNSKRKVEPQCVEKQTQSENQLDGQKKLSSKSFTASKKEEYISLETHKALLKKEKQAVIAQAEIQKQQALEHISEYVAREREQLKLEACALRDEIEKEAFSLKQKLEAEALIEREKFEREAAIFKERLEWEAAFERAKLESEAEQLKLKLERETIMERRKIQAEMEESFERLFTERIAHERLEQQRQNRELLQQLEGEISAKLHDEIQVQMSAQVHQEIEQRLDSELTSRIQIETENQISCRFRSGTPFANNLLQQSQISIASSRDCTIAGADTKLTSSEEPTDDENEDENEDEKVYDEQQSDGDYDEDDDEQSEDNYELSDEENDDGELSDEEEDNDGELTTVHARQISSLRNSSDTPAPIFKEFHYSSEECKRNTEFNKNLKPTPEIWAKINAKASCRSTSSTFADDSLPPTPESLLDPLESLCLSPTKLSSSSSSSPKSLKRSIKFEEKDIFFDLCKNGPIQELKDFLAQNPSFSTDVKNDLDTTALHYAAMSNQPELLQYVLEFSGNFINSKTIMHLTPLHYAAVCGPLESVKLLVENGADLYAVNFEDEFPVDLAADDDVFEYLNSLTSDDGAES